MLLTAGWGDEEAYATHYSKQKNGSIFTHALISALRNLSQSEVIVTIGEAFESAKVSVAEFDAVENRKMNPLSTQLPRKMGSGALSVQAGPSKTPHPIDDIGFGCSRVS